MEDYRRRLARVHKEVQVEVRGIIYPWEERYHH